MVNNDIIRRLENLKTDIKVSPEYLQGATRRSVALVENVMSVLERLHQNTMRGYSGGFGKSVSTLMGGSSSTNRVLGNMMGNNYPFKKNRIAIIADINIIQRKVNSDPKINKQVTDFVNRKLEFIKGVK